MCIDCLEPFLAHTSQHHLLVGGVEHLARVQKTAVSGERLLCSNFALHHQTLARTPVCIGGRLALLTVLSFSLMSFFPSFSVLSSVSASVWPQHWCSFILFWSVSMNFTGEVSGRWLENCQICAICATYHLVCLCVCVLMQFVVLLTLHT